MRFKVFRVIILCFTFFISIGAFFGGVCMLIKPDGSILQMESMLPYFKVLPFSDVLFQDYTFSGIALILVNGVTNLIASILILCKKRIGYVLATIFGFTLMLWIIIQFVIFPLNALDIIYFSCGVLQLISGYIALVSYNQYYFHFEESDYPNIKADSKVLVVYFSRKGFTKKIAYIKANQVEARIEELKTKERTEGDLGFWWCGRFAMHRWAMEIQPLDLDLNQFHRIIVVTPIWVFRMCCPIRDFFMEHQEALKKKEVEIIFNHFNPWLPSKAVIEARKYANIINVISYTTMLGHTFKKK